MTVLRGGTFKMLLCRGEQVSYLKSAFLYKYEPAGIPLPELRGLACPRPCCDAARGPGQSPVACPRDLTPPKREPTDLYYSA